MTLGAVAAGKKDDMDPVTALQRVAFLLEKSGAARYKSQAFRRAADVIGGVEVDELAVMAAAGTPTRLDGIGASTAKVVTEAVAGRTPEYLAELERAGGGAGPDGADTADDPRQTARTATGRNDRHEADTPAAPADAEPLTPEAVALRALLQGDCHSHSLWSDGGASIRDMAEAARGLGHRYLVMTDHSPRLTVAHGLTAERLRQQLDEIAGLNDELAPFRILTGIEVDILADGALDQTDELLGALDVVVASAHSKLRMEPPEMTARLVAAVESPHTDVLGHCTGRLIVGRGRRHLRRSDHQHVVARRPPRRTMAGQSRSDRLAVPALVAWHDDPSGVRVSSCSKRSDPILVIRLPEFGWARSSGTPGSTTKRKGRQLSPFPLLFKCGPRLRRNPGLPT